MKDNELPRWDLTNVYPGIDSGQFRADRQKLERMFEDLQQLVTDNHIGPGPAPLPASPQSIGAVCAAFLEKFNAASLLVTTMAYYVELTSNTDTFNEEAKKTLSEMQALLVRFNHLEEVLFKGWLGALGDRLPEVIADGPVTQAHAFYLTEAAGQSKYLMSTGEEKLAGELFLSGSRAWYDLSEEVKSKLKWVVKNEQDEPQELPIAAIANLALHPDEKMRRRGYEAGLEAFASVEDALAAAINGIKGEQLTLYSHRHREDALHDSLDKARIDRATLEAMLAAVRGALPALQQFYRTKAARLGKVSLPYWDLTAPTAPSTKTYSFDQAQGFILENFSKFSEELASVAKRAFDHHWIDVGPREGKVGGAYCADLPGVEESRILLNYEDNLFWFFGLAHELGHAFHNHCLQGRTSFQRRLPMTLAETASLMCETIVTNAALERAGTREEELAILETSLDSALINIVHVFVPYLIETEVFQRRAQGNLSAREINEITERAQSQAFGNALDGNHRFKYTWAAHPHLFLPDLSFYNYPYTFGLLLGAGLYAVYQERGRDFIPQYMEFLGSTGTGRAADLAAKFGMDLHDPGFWERGLAVIVKRIERYAGLSG